MKTLIRHATLVNEGNTFKGGVLVDGERISAIYTEETAIPSEVLATSQVTDASGCLLIPGVIDSHVHFREPGLTDKADIASESRAALAGGVTTFFDMPNTRPQTTTLQAWQAKMDRAAETSLANYAFYLGATAGNLSELDQADYTRVPAVKLFLGSSTGNMLVSDDQALSDLFRWAAGRGVPVAAHCESEPLIQARRARFLATEGADGDLPVSCHSLIRNADVCYESSARAVESAARAGARLHLLHVSTQAELSLLDRRPLGAGKRLTAETCPHYLWFCQDDYDRVGRRAGNPAYLKCNPAVKTTADRTALRRALADGRIDTLGTDHAPHLPQDKLGGALRAASGMPSVQFALPLMLELVEQGTLSLETLVEKMCHAPAILYGIPDRGFLRVGMKADLVLLRRETWPVTPADVVSPCGWTPYAGETLHYKVAETYVNGHRAYRDGCFSPTSAARAVLFER